MTNVVEQTLERRVTHKYNSGWRNLDEWETMGTVRVRRGFAELVPDTADDMPGTVLLVEVELSGEVPVDHKTVECALQDTFSGSNCTHDWDCCGCVSKYAKATQLGDKEWMLLINYTRNY